MTLVVRRFRDEDRAALDRLNQRLEAGGTTHRLFPEDLSKNPDADLEVEPVAHSLYVAADDEEIRGGAWLLEQHFWVDGCPERIGWMKYPVAESLVDPRFTGVPGSMILQLLRMQPYLMVVGMGGHEAPFARLLAGIGWIRSTIPMWFRIARPFRVLRGLSYARRKWWMRLVLDVAAWSGAGWLGNRLWRLGTGGQGGCDAEVVEAFAPWADSVWETTRTSYRTLAARDAKSMDYLYESDVPGLERLRVERGGKDIGWICAQLLEGRRTSDYFGDLRVGIVTDALGRPSDAEDLLAAGARNLEQRGADLVIAYFAHEAWTAAAKRLRFLSGPSTFAFYRSPKADALLVSDTLETDCHMTRSDGDGPIR